MTTWIDRLIPKVQLPEGQSGPWSVRRVEVPDNVISRLRERHFEPGWYTQLLHERRGIVMSDTPAERFDHFEFVQAARGHVLISGLGLGMCLGGVLRRPEVTAVTVLEIEEDVIKLVAPHYQDPRVEVVHTDAREYQPPKGLRYGAVWHDIWDNICVDNLLEMHAFNRRYGRRADWKGCWAQDQIGAVPSLRRNTACVT